MSDHTAKFVKDIMMLLLDSYGEEPQIIRDAERLAEHFSMKEFTKVVAKRSWNLCCLK